MYITKHGGKVRQGPKVRRKAIMVVRLDQDGKVLTEGQKIQIGGNETYQVVCRKHFRILTKLI